MAINPASTKQQAASRDSNPASCSCLLPPRSRGFTLLIAMIFMSVMLAFGLALSSLAYKQQTLASSAVESQYAFYAADAALECALYADQRQPLFFDYASHDGDTSPSAITCDGVSATRLNYSYDATRLVVSERLSLDSGEHCADVTVYKYSTGATYLFSQGYNVPCSDIGTNPRAASRGIQAHY